MIYSGRTPYGTNQVQSSSLAITVENTDVAVFTTGSLLVSGSLTSLGGFTGSFSGSFTGSANFTTFTASNALVTGNVIVLGTASINTLVINQTQLSTGSNQLGDNVDDFQTLYGTVRIPTGSFTVTGSTTITGTQIASSGVGRTMLITSSISASANSDTLIGLDINTNITAGAFTDLRSYGLRIVGDNLVFQPSSTTKIPLFVTSNNNTRLIISSTATGASFNTGFSLTQGNTFKWSLASYGTNADFVFYNDVTNTNSLFITGNTNNVLINTSTDSGFKLDVSGSGRFSGNLTITGSATNSLLVRGSGTTSATNALLVQNSSGNTSLQVLDNRDVYVPSNLSSSGTFTAGQNTGISYNHNLYAGLGSVNITRLDTYVSSYTLGVGSGPYDMGNNNSQLYVYGPSGWGTNATLARFATSNIRSSTYMIDVGNGGSTTTVGSMARFHTIDPGSITIGGSATQSFAGLDIKFKGQTANYSQPINTSISSILFNNELNNLGFGAYTAYLGVRDIDISSSYANFASPYTAIDVRPRLTGTPSGSNIHVGININPTLGAGYNFIALRSTTGSVIFNGGNVGIGISSPNFRLDVSGSSEFIGNIQVTGSTFISSSASTSSAALQVYKSGSTVLNVEGSSGQLFSITDSLTGSLFSVNTVAGLPVIEAFSDNTVNIGKFGVYPIKVAATGTLAIITGSLLGTASLATTASFALTASLATTALTASFVNPLTQSVFISGSVALRGNQSITGSLFITASAGTGSALTVYKSGSTVVSIQGSQGELFSITDSLSGSLFSVSNISGLPILEVFSDNTTLVGNYLDPMLVTTQLVTANSGSTTIYSLPTASYDGAFYDYVVRSGSNSRAGQIMAIWSGSSVNYTDNSTTDFGSTANLSFNVIVSGSNMVLRSTVTTGSWTVKTIIRSI